MRAAISGRTLTIIGALTATWLATATGAMAAPAPVTVTAGPNVPGLAVIEAERKLANKPGDPQTYRINPVLFVRNGGASPIKLTKYTVGSFSCNCSMTIAAGVTQRIIPSFTAKGSLPVPASLAATLEFEGFDKVQKSFAVRVHRNETPSGAYNFPMKQSEVAAGTYWWNFEDTDVDSHHHGALEQIHAYDFLISRWDAAKKKFVTRKTGDGNAMTNFLAYGKGIYAMDDGVVLECRRSLPNQAIGSKDGQHRYGNAIWIRHGSGEVAAYAHTIPGSIPAALCPVESVNKKDGGGTPVHAQPIAVRAGQLIGRVGNTGNTSEPHLHLSIAPRAPSDVDDSEELAGPGLPLHFDSIETAPFTDPTGGVDWVKTPDGLGGGLAGRVMFRPHPCGWNPPGAGAVDGSYVNVTAPCLKERVIEAQEAGYLPVTIDGYLTSQGPRFNVSMRPGRPATQILVNMTPAGYQSKFNSFGSQGYRLIWVDSYRSGASTRYAAVWAKEGGPALTAYHGVTHTTHAARFGSLTKEGFRPKVISVVGVDGQRRYTAIYEKVDVGGFIAETVPVANMQNRFNALTGQGLRPVYLDGFSLGSTGHLSTIWTTKASAEFVMNHGLTGNALVQATISNRAQGRLTAALTGYRNGSALRFAGLWRK